MENTCPMVVVQNAAVRLALSIRDNRWTLTDRRSGVAWGNRGPQEPWLAVKYGAPDEQDWSRLALRAIEADPAGHAAVCRFADRDGNDAGLAVAFRVQEEVVRVYVQPDEGIALHRVELFGRGLEAAASEAGDALAPIRMGLLLPAAGDAAFELHLGTYDYEGAHMAMAGLLKSGSVLMATWGDPYVRVNLSRELGEDPRVRASFTLAKSARSIQLHCLGPGDLSTLAEAYRARAAELGYRVTLRDKMQTRPQAGRLAGASNVKLWTALARRIDEDLVETSVDVCWTFDEAAQIAEHLKNDLELEHVLFHLGGWTRYGYDCRHPDNMPANPECGGNEGLADCARRVQTCGYLFCLHDNYQDMYRDAPSWDEACIQKRPDGSLQTGGLWLGGRAYLTCAREALKLAQRPQNLPLTAEAFAPDLYFIDTTYAVGPQECFDPRHPLTKQDDIRWKQALSDYARDTFGMFGSECGREWAVAHADFFEGLASVSGKYYHNLDTEALGGRTVPFFDMVFHDCIAIHGKYGYKPEEMAEQVIHHVAMGRTLYYHCFGHHLYWQSTSDRAELPPADGPADPAAFTRAHNGWAQGLCLLDRFLKNTHEVLSPLYGLTAHARIDRYEFLDADRRVRQTTFSNGVRTVVNGGSSDYTTQTEWGQDAVLPAFGFVVEADTFAALHARSWNGLTYDAPVLFTLTSLDDQPLATSGRVRVFHGFGEAALRWRDRVAEVVREAVV